MDPTLAEIYGTNQVSQEDLEKTAAAELAENLADEGQTEMGSLSEEDLEAAAEEILSEVSEPEGDETQEKIAEADYLGRTMAHAYVNELQAIEKEAAAAEGAKKAWQVGSRVGRALEGIGSKLTPNKVSDKVFSRSKIKSMREARKGGASMGDVAKSITQHSDKGYEAMGKLHKGVGAGAIGVGASAAGYGVHKAMEKKSSALDELVELRALEILNASGIDPASLAPVEQEKVSEAAEATRDVLAETVEQRAWELLGAHGVVPQE